MHLGLVICVVCIKLNRFGHTEYITLLSFNFGSSIHFGLLTLFHKLRLGRLFDFFGAIFFKTRHPMSLFEKSNRNVYLTRYLNSFNLTSLVRQIALGGLPQIFLAFLKAPLPRNKAFADKSGVVFATNRISFHVNLQGHRVSLSVFIFSHQSCNWDYLLNFTTQLIVALANLAQCILLFSCTFIGICDSFDLDVKG